MKKIIFVVFHFVLLGALKAEDGYRLWLRYDKIQNTPMLQQYQRALSSVQVLGNSSTISAAKAELLTGLEGLLGKKITSLNSGASLVAGTTSNNAIKALIPLTLLNSTGSEGFVIYFMTIVFPKL